MPAPWRSMPPARPLSTSTPSPGRRECDPPPCFARRAIVRDREGKRIHMGELASTATAPPHRETLDTSSMSLLLKANELAGRYAAVRRQSNRDWEASWALDATGRVANRRGEELRGDRRMGDVGQILGEVRALADRGDHQAIGERDGTVDHLPQDDAWQSTELLFEIGRAFGMLGNEDKLERYLQRCAELSPRRAAVFHCSIGWFFQRKKKWTKALRWYDRALLSFP